LAVGLVGGVWGARLPATPGRANAMAASGEAVVAAGAPLELPGGSGLSAQSLDVESMPMAEAAAERMAADVAESAGPVAAVRGMPPGSTVHLEGVVIVPPGLINGAIYVADSSGAGVRVYLPNGDFPALALGDQVQVMGQVSTFRGEVEVVPPSAGSIERTSGGMAPEAMNISPSAVGEGLEGQLVATIGVVAWVDDDSLYLADLHEPASPPLRVVVQRSLGWARPQAAPGEVWRATGVIGQMEGRVPGEGYRLLIRFPGDLERVPIR